MKKFKNILTVLVIAIVTSGCNQYLEVETEKDVYYGAFKSVDFSHCDVQLFNKDTEQKCAGMLFIHTAKKPTKDDAGKKNSEVYLQLSCNDGKVIQSTLNAYTLTKWTGKGYDQFNNEYDFKVITKKNYNELSNNHKIKSSSYKPAIKELVKY